MKKIILFVLCVLFFEKVNSQDMEVFDTLGAQIQLDDSIELAKPSNEYYYQLNLASSSDCFCSSRIFFKITIEATGEINNIHLLKGSGTCWDDVLLESIKKSSPWIPAKKNGVAIKIDLIVPIYFGPVVAFPCK